MLAAPPHADCGYYSITGNPVLDIAIYALFGFVLLAVFGGVIALIVGAFRVGRG